jgi:hypothetical protein
VFSLIATEKTNFPVAVLCRVLGVNRTAFHNWERRAPSDRALEDAWLTAKIKQIHAASRASRGRRRSIRPTPDFCICLDAIAQAAPGQTAPRRALRE